MQKVLEPMDHALEETWQSQETITAPQRATIPQQTPGLWGRLRTTIGHLWHHRERGALEYRSVEMHALDHLARNFPDVYVQASNY